MLLIKCPYCGERDESEFSFGGEGGISRPLNPGDLSDDQWSDYLFNRTNPRGPHDELWNHAQGCRRWFNVRRDTVTYRISSTRPIGSNE